MYKNILFRCDASKKIGFGHIIRCLALAKEFVDKGHKVIFCVRKKLGKEKIIKEGFKVIVACESKEFDYERWILSIVEKECIDIFIGDVRDNFSINAIRQLNVKKILTVAIDEISEYAKECDLCFYPPYSYVDKKVYRGIIYQGFEYVMLRKEFYKPFKKKYSKIPNILVMMGATDKYNLTLKIINKLISYKKNINILTIVREDHQDFDIIKHLDERVKVYLNVEKMANFLQNIDIGIIAFGVSAYELLAMKIRAIHICLDDEHEKSSKIFDNRYIIKRCLKDDIDLSDVDFNKKVYIPNLFKKNMIASRILELL